MSMTKSEYNRRYLKKHPNVYKAWRKANPDYQKQWQAAHPGYLTKYAKEHYDREYNRLKGLRWRATASGKRSRKRISRKYYQNNPKRVKAWIITRKHITVFKPCEVCGSIKTDRHHTNIDKPLEVQFLCRLHHKQAELLLKH